MTPKEKLIIEMNMIARLNISEIEKKRRMNVLVDEYTNTLLQGMEVAN